MRARVAGRRKKVGSSVLAGTAHAGCQEIRSSSVLGHRWRRNRGPPLAESSVYAGFDPSLRLPLSRAQRQSCESTLSHQRRACSSESAGPPPTRRRWRRCQRRNRIDGGRCQCCPRENPTPGHDPPRSHRCGGSCRHSHCEVIDRRHIAAPKSRDAHEALFAESSPAAHELE